ncbi:MAG: Smr/MutS family protein [Kiritimatiellae bacterium]|nr:Smr/MutS family protein [Kiritimatiellia bacterium]
MRNIQLRARLQLLADGATRDMKAVPEYDLHGRGMLVDDATSELDRLISRARNGGARVFAVVTGYGSTGGTSRIKSAVLAACRKYLRQNHIRGFLDGEYAGDIFSKQFLSFPDCGLIPNDCKRCPNPGIVFIAV